MGILLLRGAHVFMIYMCKCVCKPESVQILSSHSADSRRYVSMDFKLTLSVCSLLALIPVGTGVYCHVCSSLNEPDCADPFMSFNETTERWFTKTDRFLRNCGSGSIPTEACRKVWHQTAYGDEYVTRSCEWRLDLAASRSSDMPQEGYIVAALEDEPTVSDDTRVIAHVFSCFGDGCNSASMFSVSSLMVMLVLLATLTQ